MPEPDEYLLTTQDGQLSSCSDVPGQQTDLETVGDFELLSELARGGMGIVYRARQRSLNRIVALKMLLSGRVTSDVGRARFRAEAEATAELEHPNIVPIFEIGEHSGRLFFSMKLIDGGTLADLLRKSPRPALHELITALVKVCRAVHYAHQRGILHRDLKPSNVLIDSAGEPFVADFGLAKRLRSDDGLTVTGALLGTPAYMAPEQAGEGVHGVTTLTDVYALGAILYEVLTGRPPFTARDINALLAQVRTGAPDTPSSLNPSVPRDLELVCLKCLAKEPGERYASAGELADELECWLRGDPVQVRAPGLISRVVLWARQNSRTAMWSVIIGTVWGLFGLQLPLALRALSAPLRRASNTLAGSVNVPQSSDMDFLWGYLWLMLLPLGIFVQLSGGMLTYLATRSRDRWAYLGSGFAVGLIGGVISFTLYIGPAFVVLLALVPATGDLQSLGKVVSDHEEMASQRTRSQLLESQPELANVPEPLLGERFVGKIRARIFVGIFEGIALGMLVTFVTAMPLAIGGAAFADFAVRRSGSVRAALPLYLEMFALLTLIVVTLVVVILCLSLGWRSQTLSLALWILLVVVAVFGTLASLGRWEQRDRWVGYWIGFGAVSLLFQSQGDWLVVFSLLILGLAFATLIIVRRRIRRADAAFTVVIPASKTIPPAEQTQSFQ